jgi:hypothetical protein
MFTKAHLVRHYHNAKNFLGRAYHTGKNILGHVDHGVRTAKEIYSVIEPVLQQYAPEQTTKLSGHLMRNYKKYDSIRDKVIEGHTQVEHLARKMKPHRVSLGLE